MGYGVAHSEMSDVVAHWKCGGSLEMWWLIRDVVAHLEMSDVVTHSEMWWLIGDVVAHSEMW